MKKEVKKLKMPIIIAIILVVMMLFCGLNCVNNNLNANSNASMVAETADIAQAKTIEEKCRDYTNNYLDFEEFDRLHIEKYIPIELFHRVGTYGYIGKYYGFMLEVINGGPYNTRYSARALFVEVECNNDFSTSSLKYKMTGKAMLGGGFNESPTSISMNYGAELLYIGDILLVPEFNTIHELSTKDVNYNIAKDNSTYVDFAVVDYTMEIKDDKKIAMSYLSVLNTVGGPLLDAMLGGFPASKIIAVLMSIPDLNEVVKGEQHNSPSYEQQVARNCLETACAISMGSEKFLSAYSNHELTMTIKYDNKLHTSEQFQMGMKVGFNIYEDSPVLMRKQKVNSEEMLDSYAIFESDNGSGDQYKILYDKISIDGNKVIEKNVTNKFLNNGKRLDLTIRTDEDRYYDFIVTENTEISEKRMYHYLSDYHLYYDMKNVQYCEVKVDKNDKMQYGENKIYSGFSKMEVCKDETEAYKINFSARYNMTRIYITDEDGNILNSSNAQYCITYILQKDVKYKIYVNNSQTDVYVYDEISNDTEHYVTLYEGQQYYFSFQSQLRNYVNLLGCDFSYEIYDSKGERVGDVPLSKNEKYYFRVFNGNGFDQFSLSYYTLNGVINQQRELNNKLNEVILFHCQGSFVYNFGGNFDVYNRYEDNLLTNVNSAFLEKGNTYYIINKYYRSQICIEYEVRELELNAETTLEPYVLYELQINDYGMYITNSDNESDIYIYDTSQTRKQYDYGYKMPNGKYYLYTTAEKVVKFEEHKEAFIIEYEMEDSNIKRQTVYYGYPFQLAVPTRECYRFDGWYYGNVWMTNELGVNSYGYSYYENIRVDAKWFMLDIFCQIQSDGSLLWVTDEGQLTENKWQGKISIEIVNSIIDGILEMQYTDKLLKDGYYKNKITRIDYVQSYNDCIFQFKVDWQKEKYDLVFEEMLDDKISVQYGDNLTDFEKIFAIQNDQYYVFEYWYYEQGDEQHIITFEQGIPFRVFDFTAGFENNHSETILIKLRRQLKQVNLTFNIAIHSPSSPTKNPVKVLSSFSELLYLRTDYNIEELIKPHFDLLQHYEIGEMLSEHVAVDSYNMLLQIVYNYDTEITIRLIGKEYKITYSGRFFNGSSVQTTYNVINPYVQLPNVYSYRVNHLGWEAFGKTYGINDTVKIEDEYLGNIYFEAIFGKDWIILKDGSRLINSYSRATYNALFIDLRQATNDIIIKISGYIEYVEILGNGAVVSNFYFSLGTNDDIDVKFENCNLEGRTPEGYDLAEERTGCVVNFGNAQLDGLYIAGKVIIRQHNFYNHSSLNKTIPALLTEALDLRAADDNAELFIYAGNGEGNEEDTRNGACAGSAWFTSVAGGSTSETRIFMTLRVFGGNGVNGIDGRNGTNGQDGVETYGWSGIHGEDGSHGGSTGYTIFTSGIFSKCEGGKVYVTYGIPGNGGKGGNGANGLNAVWFVQSSTEGGNAGDGGNGGEVFLPIVASKINNIIIIKAPYSSRGGSAGQRGYGGKPLVGENRQNGRHGEGGIGFEIIYDIDKIFGI